MKPCVDPVARARRILARLAKAHPDAGTTLDHETPFELLVATVLSAQTTDARVNRLTPELFRRFPDPRSLAAAGVGEIEEVIRPLGFYNAKARALRGLGRILVERHAGDVPSSLEELIALPGVGRKTANVVLGSAFGRPEGVVVDTHVGRLARRLGWSRETDPAKVERDISALFPKSDWVRLGHLLILHGRRFCLARAPRCEGCPLLPLCPRVGVLRRTFVGTKGTKTPAESPRGGKPRRAEPSRERNGAGGS